MFYFHLRRVLGFSRQDFDALPWYEQRLYREQLVAFLSGRGGDGAVRREDSAATAASYGVQTRRALRPAG